jgi:heme exporter protein B
MPAGWKTGLSMMAVPKAEGLIARGLACNRGERTLFSDLSFAVEPGGMLLVRGPNGVGKSSLLRVLAGLLPFTGEVELGGLPVDEDADYWRQLVWLGHLDGIQPNETAREAVGLRARLWGRVHAAAALTALNIESFAGREARHLSAGQKRRAALAGVIATGARLWLLDEPTVGLDGESVGLFQGALDTHLAAGGMAVIVTHEAGWEGNSVLNLENYQKISSPPQGGEGNAALVERSSAISEVGEGEPLRLVMVLTSSQIPAAGPLTLPRLSAGALSLGSPLPVGEGKLTSSFPPILVRELRLALRQGGQLLTAVLFFILVIMLLAFGVGPDPLLLQSIAPGAVWVAALLSCLLSLERLFGADYEAGALDQLQASPLSGEALVFAKMVAHWLTSGLPLTIASLAAGLLLHLPLPAIVAMLAALALGTPVLSLLGGAIAALLLGARRGSLILTLLLLPLYIPTLIFGAAAIQKALAGGSCAGPRGFLAALLALALPLAPIAAAAALEE